MVATLEGFSLMRTSNTLAPLRSTTHREGSRKAEAAYAARMSKENDQLLSRIASKAVIRDGGTSVFRPPWFGGEAKMEK